MVTMKIERIACPCWLRCAWHSGREKAVNTVLTEGMIASKDLNTEIRRRYTVCEARKAIHFLHHRGSRSEKEGCTFITVLKKDTGGLLRAKGRNRIFVSKLMSNEEAHSRARTFLTSFQKKILEVFEKEIFKTHYLSSYEVKKLIPRKGDRVVADLNRLREFGFVKESKVSLPKTVIEVLPIGEILKMIKKPPEVPFTFYLDQKSEAVFDKEKVAAAIDEITEFQVVYDVLGTLMKVYPSGLVKWNKDIVRTESKDLLVSAKGLSFDAFPRFEHQIGNNQFMAIDVYTRFPVGNEVAKNFCRKIRHVGNAFGLLLAKSDMATDRASFVCKKNGVGFATIEDLGIDYDKIRDRVKKGEWESNFRRRRIAQFKQATTEWNRKEGFVTTQGKRKNEKTI